MANLQVDIAVVTDPVGKILFVKAIDQDAKREVPVPDQLQRHIMPGQKYLQGLQGETPLNGVLWLENQPVLLAAQRILKAITRVKVRVFWFFCGKSMKSY